MPQTIYGGQVRSETLRAGKALTISVEAGSGGVLEQWRGGRVVASSAISSTTTVGPFIDDTVLRISAFGGATLSTSEQTDQIASRPTDAKASALDAAVSGAWNPLLASGGVVSRVLKRFTDTVGVTAANSGTAAAVSIDAASPFGRPAYKVAMPAGNAWAEVQLAGRNIAAFNGHVIWRVWVEDYTAISQMAVYAGTSGYSRYYQNTHGLSNTDTNRFNGEHQVVAGPTRASAVNTFLPGSDALADTKLRITPGAGGGNVWVDACLVPGVGRPTHIITHDDSSVTWIENALPYLAANGLKATFGIYTTALNTAPTINLTSAQVAQIAAAGHQISSHNVTNTAHADGIAGTQDAATYTADFVAASATLSAIVGQAFDGSYHPWVQGKNTSALHATMRAAGLSVARGVDSAAGYNFPQVGLGNGVMALKIQALHTLSQAQILAAVEATKAFGLTTVWMVHEITPAGGVGVETAIANYAYLCSLIGADVAAGRAVHRTAAKFGREVYAERLVASALLA